MASEPIEFRSADGRLQLYAQDSGAANAPLTVLCLHGLTRNGRDFESLVEHLSSRYRVITADQRGRGRSQWDPDPTNYQIAVYAKDMAHLLDHLKVPRAVVIGTSMGGLISMVLGVTQPSRVRGIVLNDIGPEVLAAGLNRLRESLLAPADVLTWADAAQRARQVNGVAFPDYDASDWDAFARRTYTEDATGRPVVAYDPAILKALSPPGGTRPTLWPLWAQLGSMPMLAIRGGLSDFLSEEILEKMQAQHQGLTTVTLPGRGHAPMLDERDAVAAIDRFLESFVTDGLP